MGKGKHICIGLLAHVDAGKTTLTEQLLKFSGKIRSAGSVDKGTTQTDWMEVERRRGISVRTACAEISFGEDVIQIVDTPGHVDFSAEVDRSLQVLDAAVLVISGAEGVQAQTKVLFRALSRMKIPVILAVNKIDRAGFSPKRMKKQIAEQLTEHFVFLEEAEEREAGKYEIFPETIGSSLPEEAFEKLAEMDEELEGMFLEDRLPSSELLSQKFTKYVQQGEIFPAVYLCAREGRGVSQLTEVIRRYMPDGSVPGSSASNGFASGGSASDSSASNGFASGGSVSHGSETGDGALQGIVFQIRNDPVMGRAAFIRLYGGSLKSRDTVPIFGKKPEEWEKATQIRKIQGGKLEDVGKMGCGEIAAVYGLSSCRAGDRIGENITCRRLLQKEFRADPLLLVGVSPEGEETSGKGPGGMMSSSVSTADCSDRETALAKALTVLSDEDPLLSYERNPLTGKMAIRVMGMVQIEILKEILETRFGLKAVFSRPGVIYKEKPGHRGIGLEVYTMPKPCWAVVRLQVDPLPEGSGIVFESVIKEKELPYRYQSHVEESLKETFRQGIYGWEVIDAKVTLIAGQSHHVHTHPLDFFVATPVAALRALTDSESVLMEPWMKLTLSGQAELVGKVLGQVIAMDGTFSTPEEENGDFVMEACAPLRKCLDYPVTFRSLTSGKGSCFMEFDSYRPCEPGFLERLPRKGVDPLDVPKWILSCRSAY